MMRVGLIACTATKGNVACAAQDLYMASDWFKKARAYLTASCGTWYILSALHGLLNPERVTEPYSEALNSMTAPERRSWRFRVGHCLLDKFAGQHIDFILFGGPLCGSPHTGMVFGKDQRMALCTPTRRAVYRAAEGHPTLMGHQWCTAKRPKIPTVHTPNGGAPDLVPH